MKNTINISGRTPMVLISETNVSTEYGFKAKDRKGREYGARIVTWEKQLGDEVTFDEAVDIWSLKTPYKLRNGLHGLSIGDTPCTGYAMQDGSLANTTVYGLCVQSQRGGEDFGASQRAFWFASEEARDKQIQTYLRQACNRAAKHKDRIDDGNGVEIRTRNWTRGGRDLDASFPSESGFKPSPLWEDGMELQDYRNYVREIPMALNDDGTLVARLDERLPVDPTRPVGA